jgi:hypothetical protein
MFKKSFLLVLSVCFLLGWATKAEVENVEGEADKDTVADTVSQTTIQNKVEKGYRIEVAEEKLRGGENKEEIRFVSPEGKVVKNIRLDYSVSKVGELWHIESTNLEAISEDKSKVIISEFSSKTRYNPEELFDYPGYEGEIWNHKVKLMNGRGEESFTKQFKTYPGNDPTASYFKTLFSKEGNAVLFFYRDSEHVFHVGVYDTEGNKLAEVSNENYLRDLQISPDGKIVGAETEKRVGKAWLRHLFFLDVETGETKVVKAEGKGWKARYSLPPEGGTPLGKIQIGWGIYENLNNKKWIKGGREYLTFDQLPNDLSNLFRD